MKKLRVIIGLALSVCLPVSSFAIGDAAVVAQLVINKAANSVKLEKEISQLMDENSHLKALLKEGLGNYGYGNLLNSPSDLNQREWSPSSWQNALHGLAGNNPARYQQLMALYKQNHPSLSASDYQKGASAANTKAYENQVSTNRAATVQANYAFDDIQKHLQDVHQLSQQIDKTQNTKAAMDLNNRLLTELSYIAVQELKMQTILSEQMSETNSATLADKAEAARFNQLPVQK